MSFWYRVLIAFLVLVFDAAIFFVPLGALFIAYVLLARPRWVKEWIDQLYA